MDERRKKLLFIFLFILAVVGIATVLYLLFFRAITPNTPQTGMRPGSPNSLPRAATGTPSTISGQGGILLPSQPNTQAVDIGEVPTLPDGTLLPDQARTSVIAQNVRLPVSFDKSGNGDVGYYDANDGKFYSVNDNGTKTPLSETVFPNVSNITWGNKTEKAIIGFPDGSQVIYDFDRDKQTTIPRYWQDLQFSPEDTQIAAKSVGSNPTNRFLITANSDGSNPQPIEEMGNNQDKVMVNWSPNDQTIAFSRTGEPLGADREQILLVGKHHENFKGLVVEGRGFIPNWSPDGSQLIYSVWSGDTGYVPTLWISGAEGDQINSNRRRLSIGTWADKCTWANNTTVICGVPKNLPAGAGLQRSLFDVGPDTLYKLDLANGQISPLGDPSPNAIVKSVSISPDGKTAIVLDGRSDQVIKMQLY